VEDVRITFDLKLRSGTSNLDLFDPRVPVICPHDRNVEILEVKFNNYLPEHIRSLLRGTRAERSAISKYILCRRFGIERPQPDASKVAALYDGYDGTERRNALDKIQEMCKQIGGSIERSIEPQQRNRSNNRNAR
jgi:hypothetical protein